LAVSARLALDLVAASVAVAGVAFACGWLRPRVAKRRSFAVALLSPGVVLVVAAAALVARDAAWVTPPLWSLATISLAAGWAFWPVDRHWRRFEAAFRAHTARHEEFHVPDGR